MLVSAAAVDGGDDAGGLEEEDARFKAPFESILIGESCFLLVGDRLFFGLPRLTLEFEDVDEAVDDDELKEGVIEMLGAMLVSF